MYRQEHPNPQAKRANWQNLNGTWEFDFDFGKSGRDRRLFEGGELTKEIEVPFCPESPLSGIGYRDFIPAVWYRRTFTLTEAQMGGRVLLHFGAVDYLATVYINGRELGRHRGGFSSFTFDITDASQAGENVLTVYVEDDTRSPEVPSGKQSPFYNSRDCVYTRTTGIWQTVWLEFVPNGHIASFRLYPDAANGTLRLQATVRGAGILRAEAFYGGKPMGAVEKAAQNGSCDLEIALTEKHLWEIGNGRLYDLVLTFGEDRVESYFGLRSVCFDGKKFLLNGKSVFLRLVLDQGFYPDGVYTAPSEEALVRDIELSQAVGFDGARLHQKVFEPLFLYHCDRLGYIVWGEYPNWELDITRPEGIFAILPEWLEVVERDFNHPSIVTWCPFNETWNSAGAMRDTQRCIYRATKATDPTRPCVDTSGGFHTEATDFYDTHDYEQDPAVFRARYDALMTEGKLWDRWEKEQRWDGKMPYCMSEYGGIRWSDDKASWGYGKTPESEEEFYSRFKGLTDALLDNDCIFSLCYTQLYDVEQEQNGLYTYDRKPKFKDMEFFRSVLSRKAKIEE